MQKTTKIIQALKAGKIVALETDTSFSLSVVFDNINALKALVAIKGTDNPLLVLLPSINEIEIVVEPLKPIWLDWLNSIWPCPITFILPAKEKVSRIITKETGNIAVRVPKHNPLLAFLKELGKPVIGTSANPSLKEPAFSIAMVKNYFPNIEYIWSTSPISSSRSCLLQSTIVDLTSFPPNLVRAGKVDWNSLPDPPQIGLLL